MWTNEKIVQQPEPHIGRKALLMRTDRRRMRIFLFPHMHAVAIKNPILCECGLSGNQHIAGKMGIDGNLIDLPPTKGEGGTMDSLLRIAGRMRTESQLHTSRRSDT
jgi:hypothetical protein